MSNRTGGQRPEDIVDRAAAALRHAETPPGPSEELLNKTLARLGAAERSESFQRGWWTMRVVRRSAMAAGVVLVVTAGLIAMMLGRGAGVAFADVVEQARAAKAVRCLAVTEATPREGDPAIPQTARAELLMVDPGWLITRTGGITYISNEVERRALVLTVADKRAMIVDAGAPEARAQLELNFLEQLRQMPASGGKPLGDKLIDGVQTKGFSVERQGTSMEVWVDPRTERPVAATMHVRQAFMPPMKVTFSHFDWEPKYDPALLSLTPPKDYVVTQINMAAPTEADVVAMLQQFAKFDNGMLPDHLTVVEMSKGVVKMIMAHQQNGAIAVNEALNKELGEITQKIGRGWAFISDTQKGSKWHYAGKGMKLGEAGKPVMWYQPNGGTDYRVIDADLTVRTIRAAQGSLLEGEPLDANTLGSQAPVVTVQPPSTTRPR